MRAFVRKYCIWPMSHMLMVKTGIALCHYVSHTKLMCVQSKEPLLLQVFISLKCITKWILLTAGLLIECKKRRSHYATQSLGDQSTWSNTSKQTCTWILNIDSWMLSTRCNPHFAVISFKIVSVGNCHSQRWHFRTDSQDCWG